MRALPLIAVAALLAGPSFGAELAGKPRVVDGGTIEIGGQSVRLFGIEAPDESKMCVRAGEPWTCGREAAFALADLLAEHWVTCVARPAFQASAITAVCHAGPVDIGETMVRRGWAFAARSNETSYGAAENEARAARRGLWQAEFQMPAAPN